MSSPAAARHPTFLAVDRPDWGMVISLTFECRPRDLGCGVGRAVVHDDHLEPGVLEPITVRQALLECCRGVVGADHHREPWPVHVQVSHGARRRGDGVRLRPALVGAGR